jgi:uncharacterized protein YdeI (YjbR/CyaY-like superfamily)
VNARSGILDGVRTPAELPILDLPDRVAWEDWLSANHASSAGVWVKIAKKGASKPTVTQAEAIDAAVCFGWIDGQVGRYDEQLYLQRFTPRRPRSKWSATSRERAQRLIAQGLMQPAGLAAYQAAMADAAATTPAWPAPGTPDPRARAVRRDG